MALFSSFEYSRETQKTSISWNLVGLDSGNITVLTNDSNVSELIWLRTDDSSLLYINRTNADIRGGIELWLSNTASFEKSYVCPSRYKTASLPGLFSGLKTAITERGDIKFLVYGQSYRNGTAYNKELAATPLSTAHIYDNIFVRDWDTWFTTTFNAVFSGTLKKEEGAGPNLRYSLDAPLRNLVAGMKDLESPSPPFGDSSDYDLSANGIWVAFKSKAPELPRAHHPASYIYIVPHDASMEPELINGPDSPLTRHGITIDSNSPSFSPDSRHIAYFQIESISYKSDRRVLYVYTIHSKEIFPAVAHDWDRSQGSVKWTVDGKNLIVHACYEIV
ncbi:Dipeptidyl-peptidase 5 [Penicillium subrubescens]|uniref:Dipeptidyl-peptidase 5 n=1 Tax=Penicillium subrubescens TaxID=1316194 RepID=A0A1Q5UF65_9EURO|nr:Dipeptidyl-peptidase 5 [Penicillium subrubescens]